MLHNLQRLENLQRLKLYRYSSIISSKEDEKMWHILNLRECLTSEKNGITITFGFNETEQVILSESRFRIGSEK